MASRYWVGGSDSWDATAASKWATTSGGAGGASAPTTSDDVFLDAASGAITVTIATGAVCLTLDCTGFTGTLSHPSLVAMTVAGNLFRLVAGMTYTTTAAGTTARIDFTSTSGTCLITTAGKSLPGITFNGVGGTWQLQDSFTNLSTQTVTLTRGTFTTNNQACSIGIFNSSNTNTRVLNLGSSAITLTGGGTNTWECSTSTGMTLNAGTSSITINPAGSGTGNFAGGGLVYYDLSVIKSGGGLTITGANTFNNLTQNNTILGGGNRRLSLPSSTTTTINGVLTYIGNGNTGANRGLVTSGTVGLTTTVALGATGTVVTSNADYRDVVFTGTNTPVTGTSLGDCGGCSGITFATPRTLYWVGNSGGIDDSTHWSTTSGGTSGSSWPLPQDTAIFDVNSFTTTAQAVQFGSMRVGAMNFTLVRNSPALNFTNTNGAGHECYGDFILSRDMSITVTGAAGGAAAFTLLGRGSQIYNQAGLVPPSNFSGLTFNSTGGTYTLQGDVVLDPTRTLALTQGTLNANNFTVTVGAFSSSNSNVRTLTMGTGTWNLTGTGLVWGTGTSTNLTVNSTGARIKVSNASASAKSFAGGSKIWGNIWITGNGTGSYTFTQSSTFTEFKDDNTVAHSVLFNAGSTFTISTWVVRGTAGNMITLASTSGGTAWNLSIASGTVASDYVILQDSAAAGGATYYAGLNSTNVSGNTGWIFGRGAGTGGVPGNFFLSF